MPTDRFAVLTDAAIDVLADLGMRGLTHRAVDTRAGLAQGTTSAYFRTRKALIEAVVRRLADLDAADAQAASASAATFASQAARVAESGRVAGSGSAALDRSAAARSAASVTSVTTAGSAASATTAGSDASITAAGSGASGASRASKASAASIASFAAAASGASVAASGSAESGASVAASGSAESGASGAASGSGGPAGDVEDLAAGIAALLDHWMSAARNRTLARYACLLEATHHPELRTILAHGDTSRAQARAMLAGAADPERAGDHLVACIDGLLFDRLVGAGSRTAPPPGTAASRADLTVAVTTLLRAFSAA